MEASEKCKLESETMRTWYIFIVKISTINNLTNKINYERPHAQHLIFFAGFLWYASCLHNRHATPIITNACSSGNF